MLSAAWTRPPVFMPTCDLVGLSDVERDFITTVRSLEQTFLSATNATVIKEAISECLPSAQLFHPAMANHLPYLRELRLQLNRYGASLGPVDNHLAGPLRTPMLLATSLYAEGEERDVAKQQATELAQAATAQRSRAATVSAGSPSNSGSGNGGYHSEKAAADRHAQYVATRFLNRQFTGDHRNGQVWSEFVADYQSIARDFDLSADMRYKLLHNILSGDAKRYYLNNVQGHATTYTEAVAMMEAEYNSHARQMQVKNFLSTYRMHNLVRGG